MSMKNKGFVLIDENSLESVPYNTVLYRRIESNLEMHNSHDVRSKVFGHVLHSGMLKRGKIYTS